MQKEIKKYKVIKTFRNVDGAVYMCGDSIELDPKRASILKANQIIGGVLVSPNKGIFETATKKTTQQATKNKSENSISKKTYENRKK